MEEFLAMFRPFLLSLVLFMAFGIFTTASAATFTVDRADDAPVGLCTAAANDCTLRGAITAANDNGAGADIINFNIPGSGVKTIFINSDLPKLQSVLTINGTTELMKIVFTPLPGMLKL